MDAPAPPCAMVIFGAAGDLTRRLLVRALYELARMKRLSPAFRLVGVATGERSTAQWRAELSETFHRHVSGIDEDASRWLFDRMTYVQADLNDPDSYRRLGAHLEALDTHEGTAGNYLFYLAIPAHLFATAVAGLAGAGLTKERDNHWRRVVIEKPFG